MLLFTLAGVDFIHAIKVGVSTDAKDSGDYGDLSGGVSSLLLALTGITICRGPSNAVTVGLLRMVDIFK